LPADQARHVCRSAAAQARQRPDAEPLRWLFEKSAAAWSEQDRQIYEFEGLQLPVFGPYGTNEMVYARALMPHIPDASLIVFDKGFLSAEILCSLVAGGVLYAIPSGS
jgi:hypothetical protein